VSGIGGENEIFMLWETCLMGSFFLLQLDEDSYYCMVSTEDIFYDSLLRRCKIFRRMVILFYESMISSGIELNQEWWTPVSMTVEGSGRASGAHGRPREVQYAERGQKISSEISIHGWIKVSTSSPSRWTF
jgi:hypothetical protein